MVEEVLRTCNSHDVVYEWTMSTFRKTSRLPIPMIKMDGTPFVWARSWNHERVGNEARALRLVARETTIPIPRLLEHGIHDDGRQYIVVERINGVMLDQFHSLPCARLAGQKHTDAVPCPTCRDQAYANALEFVESTVLPQLSALTSKTRGIEGFVMPPSWITPDLEPPWKGLKKAFRPLPLDEPLYVFQHGDLSDGNIMMNPHTLQVESLIDWEYAGFYPPGMERWPGTLDAETYRNRVYDVAPFIVEFLAVEFLECCDEWEDKKGLEKAIKEGDIPDPEVLRQAS